MKNQKQVLLEALERSQTYINKSFGAPGTKLSHLNVIIGSEVCFQKPFMVVIGKNVHEDCTRMVLDSIANVLNEDQIICQIKVTQDERMQDTIGVFNFEDSIDVLSFGEKAWEGVDFSIRTRPAKLQVEPRDQMKSDKEILQTLKDFNNGVPIPPVKPNVRKLTSIRSRLLNLLGKFKLN